MTETATTTETENGTAKIHAFEKAGLGKAPFRFVGFEHKTYQACHGAPIQPGGSCDYCGTGISGFCWILSSDGKRFKVGDTCVEKTGDRGIIGPVKRQIAKATTVKRHAREDARIAAAEAILAACPEVRDAISDRPHPTAYQAENGRTLLDWCRWMLDNAGRKGKVEVARATERAVKEVDAG